MQKIGLISDTDTPSLSLMKLSAYHKQQGDRVDLVTNNLEHYDTVYVSKVFNLDLPKIKSINYIPMAEKIVCGGTGYAIEVQNGREVYIKEKDTNFPEEIEYIMPDYTLFNEPDTAVGFLSRGCPNNCGFCLISQKDGFCSRKVTDLKTFWSGQKKIKLYDANILACKDREDLIKQLIASKSKIDFSQGLDARLVDVDVAKLLSNIRADIIHFAFDLIQNEEKIINGLKIFSKHFKLTDRYKRVYVLTNYNSTPEEDYYRVLKIIELGYAPYITIYQKGTHTNFIKDLSRWCNNPFVYRSTSFLDYVPRKDGKRAGELYKDILKKFHVVT